MMSGLSDVRPWRKAAGRAGHLASSIDHAAWARRRGATKVMSARLQSSFETHALRPERMAMWRPSRNEAALSGGS